MAIRRGEIHLFLVDSQLNRSWPFLCRMLNNRICLKSLSDLSNCLLAFLFAEKGFVQVKYCIDEKEHTAIRQHIFIM
jgi:hypothetical protein